MLILSIIITPFTAFAGDSEWDPYMERHWFTDDMVNGYFIMEVDDPNKVNYYIRGMIDVLKKYNSPIFEEYYPKYLLGDYYEALMQYYSKNKMQRKRPISEVLVSGCK
jgi:hypothetical protein